MTTRLYHADSYLRTFDAEVIAHARGAVILDRTAFYPEAGGQLGDRGTLAGVAVTDTQVLDDVVRSSGALPESIAHHVTGELPAIGARVTGTIDWARRRQHMAQHTAQHLLSGTLLDRAQAATASARLGESALTIDVTRDRIPEAELAAAEDLANDLIDDDLAIRQWFPDPGELAALKLRRDPKVDANIRVVAIGDFDFSPCGGTHCQRTSQLGAIRIVGAERYKGMTRITFVAGRRTRTELFARDTVLRGLATQFSCDPSGVPAAIDKLRRDVATSDANVTQLRSRLAGQIAERLVATSDPGSRIIATIPGDAELVRAVAAKLVAAERDALLACPDETGATVVLFRAAGSTLDCGALYKQLSAKLGGRGGGKPERAEGRLASPVEDWPALVALAVT